MIDMEDLRFTIEQIDSVYYCLCDIDTLVRTDKYGEEFLSCEDCIFNGVDKEFGLDIAGCPYECTGNEDILR